jgi:NAD/NADP transhydrogenase alpha subunit
MSAANSIHGIVLAGAMLIAVTAHNAVGYVIAFLAAAFAAANVVGGYVVTGRMLKMFRRRPALPATQAAAQVTGATAPGITGGGVTGGGVTSAGVTGARANGSSANGKGPAA